ncbi:DUF2502 domain-containing protein [Acerihabitans sp. TG2]|uniref:DUF2502 domain-containing protein n=1 Tax=Acerihabitans sp. TG2 TaxID=3096008 RepID=UPI002B236C49|nr:DUF2502 domain-containing protein [Acerihabitans sp. TG2]MEA9391083.1 DUF2502 domain-containing protein [Acerihabitans sp. TG2]
MKKYAACWMLALSAMVYIVPTVVQAETHKANTSPRRTAQIGDRDHQGNYWDGYLWRSSQWWHGHQGKHLGERNQHGEYWDGGRWSPKKPDTGHETTQPQAQSHGNRTTHNVPVHSPIATTKHGQSQGNPAANVGPNGGETKQNQGENNVTLPKKNQH